MTVLCRACAEVAAVARSIVASIGAVDPVPWVRWYISDRLGLEGETL